MIKPAYSVSFLLSINIFVWQNVLYFPNDFRTTSASISYLTCERVFQGVLRVDIN